MLKLKHVSAAVLAFFLGSPMPATAAPEPNAGHEARAAPTVSNAARLAVSSTAQKLKVQNQNQNQQLKVQKKSGANRYFARESGPSWVNSPTHIKDMNKLKVLPGQVR